MRAVIVLVAATLLGCVAGTDARGAASPAEVRSDPYPEGPYGFRAGETYPPLLSLRRHFDPKGDRGVRAIVLVVSSPTAFEAMHAREPLERQSTRGTHHLLALFDHATQEPLEHQALDAFSARQKPSYEVFSAAPNDVAPGLVVHPTRFVIDPRTMKIVTVAEGIPLAGCDPDAEPLLRENGAPPAACT
ncbi:MAG: hypothetical protein ACXWUG_11830 [Polyangiales bacterium]